MLDELAMETLQEKSQHKEELGAVRLRHEKEMLGVRARYERELRELHEDKKRQEEELRGQIREEKVGAVTMPFLPLIAEDHGVAAGDMVAGRWYARWPVLCCPTPVWVLLPGSNKGIRKSSAHSGRTSGSGTLYGWSQGLV